MNYGIYEFNNLSKHDKFDQVFTQGQFVYTVSEGEIKFALYSLSYFWVEVRYHSPSNKIFGIYSFVGGETLNRYSNIPDEI